VGILGIMLMDTITSQQVYFHACSLFPIILFSNVAGLFWQKQNEKDNHETKWGESMVKCITKNTC
jgi:hypothetical protein